MKGGEKMNIASFPTISNQSISITKNTSSTSPSNQSFGSVFGQLLATQQGNSTEKTTENASNTIQSLIQLFQIPTVEEFDEQIAAMKDFSFEQEEVFEKIQLLLQRLDLLNNDEQLPTDPLQLLILFNDLLPMLTDHFNVAENDDSQSLETMTTALFMKRLLLLSKQFDQTEVHKQSANQISSFLQSMIESLESKMGSQTKTAYFAPVTIRISIDSQSTFSSMQNNESAKQRSESANNIGSLSPMTETNVARNVFSLQTDQSEVKSETLIREMQLIFKRANFGMVGGTNRLLIKLYPEHLGQIRIELLETNGVLTARLLASTALGKEMLESQMNQLRQAFLQQNLQVERIEIGQALQNIAENERETPFQQQSKEQQQSSEDEIQDDELEQPTFEEYLIELEV